MTKKVDHYGLNKVIEWVIGNRPQWLIPTS